MLVRFLIVFLVLAGTVFAQTPSFTGFIDGYYSGNFNKPPDRTNALRAFDVNHNEFSLNYAELAIEQTPAPVGFRVDVGVGDAASIVNSFEPSTRTFYEYLQQAYVSGKTGNLTVDFGKFVTPLGAEVIETKDNWNYSRSLLFNWAIPFYHFGVRTTYAVSDKVSLGATVTNGWNNVKDNNSAKTVGLSATLKPGKATWIVNYMFGNETTPGAFGPGPGGDGETRHAIDSTLIYDFNEKVSLMANYDYIRDNSNPLVGAAHLQGFAAYAKFTPTPKVVLVPRYEWFDDPTGSALPQPDPNQTARLPQTAQEFTFTSKFPIHDQMSLFAEYRRDWSDLNSFEGENGFEDSQDTVTFGVVFTFTRAGS